MTKTLRKAMLSTICMLVVAVLSLTGITYAWFTSGTTATVNGMKVEVAVADGGIQIREKLADGGFSAWAASLDLKTTLQTVKPVSSTDGVNFFGVTLDATDSSKYQVAAVEPGNNVITKNIQLTNPGATDVVVVLNAENSKITSMKNTSNNNTETAIYKAAKVAFIVGNKTVNAETGAVETTNVTYIWTSESNGGYVGLYGAATEAKNYLTATDGVSKAVTITPSGSCEIKLPANTTTDASRIVDVTIVAWLEGQDANCVNSNAGGAFDIALQFALKQ